MSKSLNRINTKEISGETQINAPIVVVYEYKDNMIKTKAYQGSVTLKTVVDSPHALYCVPSTSLEKKSHMGVQSKYVYKTSGGQFRSFTLDETLYTGVLSSFSKLHNYFNDIEDLTVEEIVATINL